MKIMKNLVMIVIVFSIAMITCACPGPAGSNNKEIDGAGSGTLDDPFLVGSIDSLMKIGTQIEGWDLDRHYKQINDIDLSTISNWSRIVYIFTGTYNGNNYKIKNLKINSPTVPRQGLFYMNYGTIKNVRLIDCDITGYYYVGGIAGDNSGNIENCSVTGNVNGITLYVGSIVGQNSGIVKNCYFKGVISGESYIGGIVGENRGEGIVETSYSIGNVSGYDYVGGVVGYNAQYIVKNCYSTGNVSGRDNVGGIVGINTLTYAIVENCYATSDVSGRNNVGGIVGANQTASVKNCYAIGTVTGSSYFGGVVGKNNDIVQNCFSVEPDTYGTHFTANEYQSKTWHIDTLFWDFTTPIWKWNSTRPILFFE